MNTLHRTPEDHAHDPDPAADPGGAVPPATPVSLAEATRTWLKIGLLSFGGPAGQIALMHRILVEERKWIDEDRFLHALNFCMLLPGPEAQQLATYVGWLLHRIPGGLIAGSLFILPGMVVMFGLSYLYVTAGDVVLMQGLFVGLKAAVIAIVVQALLRIGARSLHTRAHRLLAVLAFVAMFFLRAPFPLVILLAAVAGAWLSRRAARGPVSPSRSDPSEPGVRTAGLAYAALCLAIFGLLWWGPTIFLIGLLGTDSVFANIGLFFSKMAVVTFGGAYAVLSYVSQEAVLHYRWLAPGEMIDGLALAETTPGPLIMVTQFIGFIAAHRHGSASNPGLSALLGGVLTTWVTFAPCFLWIFLGAPFVERVRQNRLLAGALAGVTAAVVGVVLNLALWFAMHALFESLVQHRYAFVAVEIPVISSLRPATVTITAIAALLVFRFRASLVTTLALTGSLGVLTSLI